MHDRNPPDRPLSIKAVHILAQSQSLVKENPVSEGQKLDWRTGTANYKMMGLDVGRIPQVGDWGAETAGQRDGGQFFTHFWLLMGTMTGKDGKGGNVVRAVFACVGRELGPD